MATIDYAVKYPNIIDEKMVEESKTEQMIGLEVDFVGAKTCKIKSVSTAQLNNYSRTGANRYGTPEELDATDEEFTLTEDKSFSFVIDKMDSEESRALVAGECLDRQIREVIVPYIDTFRLSTMATKAGTKKTDEVLTPDNVYGAILEASEALDDAEVPEGGRQLIVSPQTLNMMKQSKLLMLDTNITEEKIASGVIAELDGMDVIKVPQKRLGTEVNFIVSHPMAVASPIKLADYKIHTDAPGISGELVEGRVYFGCVVPKNKAKCIYVSKSASALSKKK